MTSLLAELAEAPPPTLGDRRCRFGLALDAFPDDAARLEELIAKGPNVISRRTHVRRVLSKHGHPVGYSTIERHLGRTCGCYQ